MSPLETAEWFSYLQEARVVNENDSFGAKRSMGEGERNGY
jgi:hypothetical protein